MKTHSTNYTDTFIEVAEDCPVSRGEIPPLRGASKTAALLQFEMVFNHPYRYTSDEVFFEVYAERNDIPEGELQEARELFFSKGQPCFRASPLTKRYGWGLHSNGEGKVAIYGCESTEYRELVQDTTLKVVKAMKSAK